MLISVKFCKYFVKRRLNMAILNKVDDFLKE